MAREEGRSAKSMTRSSTSLLTFFFDEPCCPGVRSPAESPRSSTWRDRNKLARATEPCTRPSPVLDGVILEKVHGKATCMEYQHVWGARLKVLYSVHQADSPGVLSPAALFPEMKHCLCLCVRHSFPVERTGALSLKGGERRTFRPSINTAKEHVRLVPSSTSEAFVAKRSRSSIVEHCH